MKMLTGYHWPGNIRELENTMERAVLMAEGERITAEDLNLFFAGEDPESPTAGSVCPRRGSAWRMPSATSSSRRWSAPAGSRRMPPGCSASRAVR